MFFSICLVTMATIQNLAFIHSNIGADIYQTSFSHQLHMQLQYTYIQGDLQLSHIKILSISSNFPSTHLTLTLAKVI